MSDTDTGAEMGEVAGLFEAGDADAKHRVYEIGYHVLPTLSEDEVGGQVKALTDLLNSKDAQLVGEKMPEKIDLAYPIEKRVGGRLTKFSSASFGWVAFEIDAKELAAIKAYLDSNDSLLRYILIQTTKEEVVAFMEGAVVMPSAPTPTGTIQAPKRAEELGAEVSEEALSQALESLEKEDTLVKE
jgi:ribosomal protein S6